RRELAELIAIADDELGRFTRILEVLWDRAHRGELEDPVVASDGGPALDHRVGPDAGALTDLHVGPNDRVRPDLDARMKLGPFGDDGRLVNLAHGPLPAPLPDEGFCAAAPVTSAIDDRRQERRLGGGLPIDHRGALRLPDVALVPDDLHLELEAIPRDDQIGRAHV